MQRACEAHKWRECGQLELIEGEQPPAALVEAIRLVDLGISRRMEKQHRDFEARQEEAAKANARPDTSRLRRR